MKKSDYKDLQIWQLGRKIVYQTYKLTQRFPKTEQFSITNQMRRSAVSIPSNIAEGFNRRQPKEFKRFLLISLGSVAELETQLTLANDLNFTTVESSKELFSNIQYESCMISNFIKKLELRIDSNIRKLSA